eukprot:CAMPEP_0113899192 /NCGR_PEP_ID=MMETSP0780_2-20120614/19859_1 /TAXON_ID=652834 /ORGANISM="Palpitomonas bilix" /LENGTH=121 /DNA_ID=CAMNT_0000891261 /DNA_START=32 /DNA_END=397 /DNA_ORIENTATION=- /assembly_acc=CAM_ASM_000599
MPQKGVGVPVKLLHECETHTITVECKSGEVYRGILRDAEDSWNMKMDKVTVTTKDGKVSTLEHAYIRGGQIRFIIAPDMLKNAPMFKNFDPKEKSKTKGLGRGVGRGGYTSRGGKITPRRF